MITTLIVIIIVCAFVAAWALVAASAGVAIKQLNIFLWWRLIYRSKFGPFTQEILAVAYIPPSVRFGIYPTGLILAIVFIACVAMWSLGGPTLSYIGESGAKAMLAVGGVFFAGIMFIAKAITLSGPAPASELAIPAYEARMTAIRKLTAMIETETDNNRIALLRYWRGMQWSSYPPKDMAYYVYVCDNGFFTPTMPTDSASVFMPTDSASVFEWREFIHRIEQAMSDLEYVAAQREHLPRIARDAGIRLKHLCSFQTKAINHVDSDEKGASAALVVTLRKTSGTPSRYATISLYRNGYTENVGDYAVSGEGTTTINTITDGVALEAGDYQLAISYLHDKDSNPPFLSSPVEFAVTQSEIDNGA